jgi:hypothetical protein
MGQFFNLDVRNKTAGHIEAKDFDVFVVFHFESDVNTIQGLPLTSYMVIFSKYDGIVWLKP